MKSRSRKTQGFTLVEILIVVVILGILAAIVIPQFTSASETAKASSLTSQLQTIRSQLELYQVQHNGKYPDLAANGWSQLTNKTVLAGTLADENTTAKTYGPYLQKAPTNSFQDSDTIGTAGPGVGWVYGGVGNGKIQAVLTNVKAIELDMVDSDHEVGGTDPDFFTY